LVGEYTITERLKHSTGGTRHIAELPYNELVQKRDSYLSNKILLEFSKGKETATLRCDISDYYEHDTGDKIISVTEQNSEQNFFPEIEQYSINGLSISYKDGVFHITGTPIDTTSTTQFITSYFNDIPLDDGYYYLDYEVSGETRENVWAGIDGILSDGTYKPFIFSQGSALLTKSDWGERFSFFILVERGITNYIDCYVKVMLNKGENPKKWLPTNASMYFLEHQQVVPYVRSADGTDRPMSLYKDGTPKVFEVLGNEISYDGAVFQRISLIEVYKTII
jgi:hypothetical protein